MSNFQKTPLSNTLNRLASRKSLDEILKRGLAVPGHVVSASGAIVTIAFDVTGLTLDQVTMPIASPAYIRLPIQAGDKGLACPASFYLGGVSGLGGGTATTTLQGNLSTLFWEPIGSKNFAAVADPNSLYLMGPNGVVLQDVDGNTTETLTPDGIVVSADETYEITAGTSITFTVGSHSIVINSSGISIDGRLFLGHDHTPGTYVAGSTAVTGHSGGVV